MSELEIKYIPAIGLNAKGEFDYAWGDDIRDSQIIDTFVIHSMWNSKGAASEQFTAAACIALLLRTKEGYSCHYFIDKEGVIWRSVDEWRMAWHAGISKMPEPDNRPKVNYFSVGVELISNEEEGFTQEQYNALVALIVNVMTRLPIQNIVGHGDIAGPDVRPEEPKTDPWNFDWILFAQMLQAALGEQFNNIKILGNTAVTHE